MVLCEGGEYHMMRQKASTHAQSTKSGKTNHLKSFILNFFETFKNLKFNGKYLLVTIRVISRQTTMLKNKTEQFFHFSRRASEDDVYSSFSTGGVRDYWGLQPERVYIRQDTFET